MGEKNTSKKNPKPTNPRVDAWICLFPLKKVFVLQLKLSLPRATAERASAGSSGGKRGNNCPACPTEKYGRKNKRGKNSLKNDIYLGARALCRSPCPAGLPLAVRGPQPGCRGGPRHLIPLVAIGPPRKATGGGGSGQLGACRGCGGGPLLSAFPLGITMPIPTHPALPAAGAAPCRRRAARLPRRWGGRRRKRERARGLGWR